LSITNSTWPDLGSNPGRRGGSEWLQAVGWDKSLGILISELMSTYYTEK
jgi:hypothetical protein